MHCKYNVTLRCFRESLMPWKSDKYYIFVCVCVRLLAFACVHVGARVCGHIHALACILPCLYSMQRVCAMLWRHLWPFTLDQIFRHYLINGEIFGKNLVSIKCVVWFSLQDLSETFLILRRINETLQQMGKSLHVKYSLLLLEFNDNWISSTDFRKTTKYQFHQYPSNGSRVVPCGQTNRETDGRTDEHNEANSRFSQFCESA